LSARPAEKDLPDRLGHTPAAVVQCITVRTVLVVDDDVDSLGAIGDALVEAGWQVVRAASAKEAIVAAE
jgi:hypothetical protein